MLDESQLGSHQTPVQYIILAVGSLVSRYDIDTYVRAWSSASSPAEPRMELSHSPADSYGTF